MTRCGLLGRLGDLGHGQRGRVRREDRVGTRDPIELRKQVAFELELFERGFDDEVAVRELAELRRQGQPTERGVPFSFREPALLDAASQVPLDRRAAALAELVAHFSADRFEPGLDADLGYAGAHRAEADDADFADLH